MRPTTKAGKILFYKVGGGGGLLASLTSMEEGLGLRAMEEGLGLTTIEEDKESRVGEIGAGHRK